ncbi:YybH family protein [Salegentibacter sp. HM20]
MEKMLKFIIIFIIGSLPVLAQNSSNTEVEEILQQKNEMLAEAINSGNLEGFTAIYAEDAQMNVPGSPSLNGRKAIGEAHKSMMENKMKIEITKNEVFHQGDFATETGSYRVLTASGEEVDKGSYMALWKKIDGDWQIYRDVVSSSSGQ